MNKELNHRTYRNKLTGEIVPSEVPILDVAYSMKEHSPNTDMYESCEYKDGVNIFLKLLLDNNETWVGVEVVNINIYMGDNKNVFEIKDRCELHLVYDSKDHSVGFRYKDILDTEYKKQLNGRVSFSVPNPSMWSEYSLANFCNANSELFSILNRDVYLGVELITQALIL